MGKTVLITGATSGLGRAVAIALAEADHCVIATGRSRSKLDQLKRDCSKIAVVRDLNVAIPDQFKTLVTEISAVGVEIIDTLFVNAAIHLEHDHDHEGKPYAEWPHAKIRCKTYETNLFGAMRTVDAFLPWVLYSKDGRILFSNGTLGSFGWHHHENQSYRNMLGIKHPAYAASKAALNMEMVHLARQQPSLFVASLSPGWIETAIGGSGTGNMKPRKVETALPHITKYLVGDIDRSRSGSFIGVRDETIAW
jgi:NAD(P)-dependent dehydrogenase (short-subunit alcohol dehydrogenase family)